MSFGGDDAAVPAEWRCPCYIELNMLRAGVVSHPREWDWVGYREVMGQRESWFSCHQSKLLRWCTLPISVSLKTYLSLFGRVS